MSGSTRFSYIPQEHKIPISSIPVGEPGVPQNTNQFPNSVEVVLLGLLVHFQRLQHQQMVIVRQVKVG